MNDRLFGGSIEGLCNFAFGPSGEIAAWRRSIAPGVHASPLLTEHIRDRLAYPVLGSRRIDTRPIVT